MKPSASARAVTFTLSLLAAALWLLPYFWMVLTSLKTLPEIVSHPTAIFPKHLQLGAYHEVVSTIPLGRVLAVTTLVAVLIALLQIALALPAGYALAKLRFRGRGWSGMAVLAGLLIPEPVTFVPVFLLLAKLHLINSLSALVIPFAASALGAFLVRQAIGNIPDSIIEAARLDGASELRIIYGVLGPMVLPTLVALFLLSFVFHWNDYFWPLVMTTDDSVRTLPLAVALFREQGTGVRWHVVMAANTLLALPALALFAMAQRHLIRAIGGK